MTTRTSSQSPASIAKPSPLACTECRSKHLKCDGKQPICSRCVASEISCNYTPSRRGCKGIPKKRRKLNPDHQTQLTPDSSTQSPVPATTIAHTTPDPQAWQTHLTTFTSNHPPEASGPFNVGVDASLANAGPTIMLSNEALTSASSTQEQIRQLSASDARHVVNLYYSNFHSAHPILLPRHMYDWNYPPYLQLVVQFIGSHYSTSQSGDLLRAQTATALKDNSQRSPHMVQARLLFSIAIHARGEPSEGQAMLQDAIDLAISLGMNRQEFATLHGDSLPCLEESFRRTWWELFVVEGIMSAVHRKPTMKTSSVVQEVLLPCEDSTYTDGACFSAMSTLTQFSDRHFAEEEVSFSSSCYRIEAVQILSRVLSISNTEAHPDEVQAIDNSLAAWSHYVPPEKRDVVSNSGEIDELLFQAHMITHWATILLHMPRSELLAIHPATADIFCAKGDKQMPSTDTKHAHASKATDASKELSNLAAIRCPVQKHTPFFICALVIASVVQLAACTLHNCRCMYQHRDRITLVVGLLKSLSSNWACAGPVLVKIKRIAAKVLKSENCTMTIASTQCDSCTDSGLGTSIGVQDVPWMEFFDDPTIMSFEQFAPGPLFLGEGT
jgi:hypothetical protein